MGNRNKFTVVLVLLITSMIGVYSLTEPANTLSSPSVVYGAETTTCTDSDGGIVPEVAGFVEGVGPNGYPYTKHDICESESSLKEMYCNDTIPWGKRVTCAFGCADGACLAETACTDADGDGYALEGGACGAVDCDDADPAVNPGATEICDNGVDDDCNGLVDADDPACLVCTDADGDGYALEGGACGAVDCDDADSAVNPGAIENCTNGIDDNCNGLTDADDPLCSTPPNILIIGWDGTQRDHFLECYNKLLPECPGGLLHVKALSNDTIWETVVTSGATDTKAGWAQMFTGYDAEVTGVFNNGEYQPIPLGYTIFEKAEHHFGDENIVTMFISGKDVHTGDACVGEETTKNGLPVIENQGQPWCIASDQLDYYENDLRQDEVVGNRVLELLTAHQNDLILAGVVFRTPDVIGHLTGENSVEYSQAMINDDYWLGVIVEKLKELGIYERTLIYVTTDHGFDEGSDRHGNAPFTFLASNDPQLVRDGDRKDVAATVLERYGISLGALGDAPPIDGSPMRYVPQSPVAEGEAFIDYSGAPYCQTGLGVVNLDKRLGAGCILATGGTGDSSGYCTACGDGVCQSPESACNCPIDCPPPW
ncbi:MAG: MopE-related protein [Chloroflexota bacterium]